METVTEYQDELRNLMGLVKTMACRAAQQGTTKHLEIISKNAFGPMLSYLTANTRAPAAEHPTAITLDALYLTHAGVVAIARLTNSDDILKQLWPGMVAHANDADFRRAFAAYAIREGIGYVDVTPKLYGVAIDHQANKMLRHVGFVAG